MESFQELVATELDLDDPSTAFDVKKQITSASRRYAPEGVLTTIGWTANLRALRHIIALRTSPAAEGEIRSVFDDVARIMVDEAPWFFADFNRDAGGSWSPTYPKV